MRFPHPMVPRSSVILEVVYLSTLYWCEVITKYRLNRQMCIQLLCYHVLMTVGGSALTPSMVVAGVSAASSWWRHQMETFSALLALCAGIHWWPVNSPHKGQWRGALMCSLICIWISGWVNNREARDLRRHRAHNDVILMLQINHSVSFTTHQWSSIDLFVRASTQKFAVAVFVRVQDMAYLYRYVIILSVTIWPLLFFVQLNFVCTIIISQEELFQFNDCSLDINEIYLNQMDLSYRIIVPCCSYYFLFVTWYLILY